jgi:hypothetical protein
MDLLDLLKLMFRRWYVAAPIVALTVGAALALGASIQPEYKTSAAVLLVPPTVSVPAPAPNAPPQPGNPWLRVGEGAMAQAVQISVSAHDARTKIVAAGGDSGYEVSVINRSSILTMDITAGTRASALATVTELTKLVKDVVASKQAEYRPRAGEQITTEVLDPGENITPSRSNVLRAQIVVGVIGLLLAAALTVLFDAIARRGSASRQGSRRRARPPVIWDGAPAGADQEPSRAGHRPPIPLPVLPPRSPQPARSADAPQPPRAGAPRGTGPNVRAFTPKAPTPAGGARSDETVVLATVRAPAEGPTG